MKQGTNLADRRDQAVETVSNENHPTGAFQALGKGELVELYEPLLGCQVRYHQKRSDAESRRPLHHAVGRDFASLAHTAGTH